MVPHRLSRFGVGVRRCGKADYPILGHLYPMRGEPTQSAVKSEPHSLDFANNKFRLSVLCGVFGPTAQDGEILTRSHASLGDIAHTRDRGSRPWNAPALPHYPKAAIRFQRNVCRDGAQEPTLQRFRGPAQML